MLRFALILWRVISSRAVRVLIYLWILGWGFDRAIFWATEAAWFGSVGQGAWFARRFGVQSALFWTSFIGALAVSALLMRVAARPIPGAQTRALPRALEALEPLRRGAARLAWVVLVLGAWIGARHLSSGWELLLAARADSFTNPIWGLPLARLGLGCLWQWSLCALGATAFAGVLRALPFLAAREPANPLGLWRVLGALGALALGARGALYLVAMGEANLSDGFLGRELWVGAPLAIGGALLCAGAALQCLRRPGFKRLGVAIGLALLLPRALELVLSPLALVVPSAAAQSARNRAATRAGWNLDEAPAIASNAPPLAAHWPIWDEEALLDGARAQNKWLGNQIIDWRAASLENTTGWVAGLAAAQGSWGARHDADADNAIQWLAFDATGNVEGRAVPLADAPLPLRSFYGLEGPPLLGDATSDAGAPFENWGWKLAWAWRLREPSLLFDGARASRVLLLRGARESAERLAPFLIWDEAQLVSAPAGPRWQLVGYGATPYFRGALAAPTGEFAHYNSAVPAVVLQIDPRNGRAEFFALAHASNGASNGATNWSAPWAKTMDARAVISAPAMPLLEPVRAQMARILGQSNALGEPLWTFAEGHSTRVWRAPNLPAGVETRLATLDEAARREAKNQKLRGGGALLWPDARAPGGFWIGRPYYAADANDNDGANARSARLWRVGLTGLKPSPVATGEDARAALIEFDLKNAPAKTTPNALAPGARALALEALRAHDAAQKAATQSNWKEWEKQSARERQLLQQLAARDGK